MNKYPHPVFSGGQAERTVFTLQSSSTKRNIVKRIVSAFLLCFMLVGMVTPVLAGAGTEAYVNDDEINVRTGPGTSYSAVLFNGQKNIRLYRGQYVRIVSTQKGSDGMNWHQIVFTYNGYTKIGFMRSDFITEIGDDSAYRAYLEEQGFPESYRPYLRALYAASGGKWTFVANKTGLKWNEALEM